MDSLVGNTASGCHLLHSSQKSIDRQWNLFIFWSFPRNEPWSPGVLKLCVVVLGLNVQRHPLTVATGYRWLQLIDGQDDNKPPTFQLRPLEITQSLMLHYIGEPSGPGLDHDSKALFPPGDYGFYNLDGSEPYSQFVGSQLAYPTLTERENLYRQQIGGHVPTKLHLNLWSDDLIGAVYGRDQGQCLITNSRSNTEVTWILPPAWADQCFISRPLNLDETFNAQFQTSNNIVTLSRHLLSPFRNNRFGIDVDDNNKVVVFQDDPELDPHYAHLLSHASPTLIEPTKQFFRAHFQWCLRVHLLGGDITQDYTPDDVQSHIDALAGNEDEAVDLEDPFWTKPVGRSVLEMHFETQLVATQK